MIIVVMGEPELTRCELFLLKPVEDGACFARIDESEILLGRYDIAVVVREDGEGGDGEHLGLVDSEADGNTCRENAGRENDRDGDISFAKLVDLVEIGGEKVENPNRDTRGGPHTYSCHEGPYYHA